MSEPASRLTDSIICPTHGHSLGPVLSPGATEVLIGGLTAARYTDICQCATPHKSPLAEGAAMVLINGLPAARVGAQTLDGGRILDGDASVLIGGDTFSIPDFISIEGDEGYQAKVLRDLHRIASTPSGEKLLASLGAGGHKVLIHLGKKLNSRGEPINETFSDPALGKDPNAPEGTDPRAYDGTGIDAQISYDPDTPCIHYSKENDWAYPPGYSPDADLFHEMVHADDMAHGNLDKTPCFNVEPQQYVPTTSGELRAEGLGPYGDETKYPYSENTYRRDRGLPRRTID